MSRDRYFNVVGMLVISAASVAVLWVPMDALARSPSTSRFVEEVRPSLEPSFVIDGATVYAGVEQCRTLISDNRDLQVEFQTNINVESVDTFRDAYFYRMERGDESRKQCPEDGCHDVELEGIVRDGSDIELRIPFRDLSGESNISICEEEGLDRSYYVQVELRESAGLDREWSRPEARVVLDLIRPDAPQIVDAFATEYSIRVELEVSESEDVEGHYVVFSGERFDEGALPSEVTERSPRRIEGQDVTTGRVSVDLEGMERLWVGVAARDQAGNYSVVSESLEVSVTETDNFWDFYIRDGGGEEGGYGCQNMAGNSGESLVWWLGVVLMVVLWRRREGGRHVIAEGQRRERE